MGDPTKGQHCNPSAARSAVSLAKVPFWVSGGEAHAAVSVIVNP